MATAQAQEYGNYGNYSDYAPQVGEQYFDSFYASDFNATDADYGYNTYDYGQTGSLFLAQSCMEIAF